MTGAAQHIPVMCGEMLSALAPRAGGVYVDGTYGGGGYTQALLAAAECYVWAIDRDPEAVRRADASAARWPGRLRAVHGSFGSMRELLAPLGVDAVDGVTLDLGLSSLQLADPARGFSFQLDGPLDMRFALTGRTAADVVNHTDERELARILRDLGEERYARRIARAIVADRGDAPIARTHQLASIVRRAVPPSAPRRGGIDPATRTFQALRIHVNDELGELDRGLDAAEAMLKPSGRLAVVSFHSLEDRRVKNFLRARALVGAGGTRHLPASPDRRRPPSFRLLWRKVMRASTDEIERNPRARSARLRAAERTLAPVWTPGERGAVTA